MKTELIWEGKYDEYGNRRAVGVAGYAMPLQKIETIDEPASRAMVQGNLFDPVKAHRDDFHNRRSSNGQVVLIEYGVVIEPILVVTEKHWEKTKHAAAKRWVSAVNNWGNFGQWCFHVSREPQLLGKKLKYI